MNARRHGGEQVIDEEDEEYRGDDRALGYTSIDGVQIREEAVHSDGNQPIREETIHLMLTIKFIRVNLLSSSTSYANNKRF